MRWQWTAFDDLSVHALYAMLALRQDVFIVEQDCPYADADGADPDCHHLLGWQGESLVATLRVLPPGLRRPEICIGRVVTAASVRGTGLGRPLMQQGMDRSHAQFGPGPIWLSAQAHLHDYYASLGFTVCGPGYDEDGIPHLPMLWRA